MLSSIHLYVNKGSFKCFIGYITKTHSFPIPSCIKLSQMNGYIWDKVANLFKREFDSKPVYKNEYIKTKIEIYNGIIYTNFQHNKIPKDNKYCACLSVILLDSLVVNEDKKCYR